MLIQYLLLAWWWLFGLEIHDLKVTPSNAEVVKTVYTSVDDQDIEIFFYRETYVESMYRFGFYSSKRKVSFIVEGVFEKIPPNSIKRFNRVRYIFNSWLLSSMDDRTIANVLMTIYLGYLHSELTKNH